MGVNHKTVARCDRCKEADVFVRAAIDDVLWHSWSEDEDLENEDWCEDCVGYKNEGVRERWGDARLILEYIGEITTTEDLAEFKEELHPDRNFPDSLLFPAMTNVDTVEELCGLRGRLEKELVRAK